MIDLFGIRARRKAREEERLKRLVEKKKAYQERKAKIDTFLNYYRSKLNDEEIMLYDENKKLAGEENSKCPKCGSINVVNLIRRVNGEVHGSGHSYMTGSSSHFLLGSSSHFSGGGNSRIDGELDTLPINKCNDCSHEWKVVEAKYQNLCDEFSNYRWPFRPHSLFSKLVEYIKMEYNPEDIHDKFNSLEEKREDFCKRESESKRWNFYRNLPKYMLDYALFNGINREFYDLDDIEDKDLWGVDDGDDEYSYQMPDGLWYICKKIIGWKGNEEWIQQ